MATAAFANDKAWRLLEAALFIALTVLLLRQIDDPDIWYHLSIGREIFATGGIPEFEFLVFPNAGRPGEFHEWGFGLFHFMAHKALGFWGMSLLNTLLASGTIFLLYRSVRSAGVPNPYHWLALFAVVGWLSMRMVYRPEMVLYLALAAEIYLLERYLRQRDWRLLAPIPVIGLLLSQAHPSVVFMLGVLGVYGVQVLWEARREWRGALPTVAALVLVAAATVLMAALNPYGFRQVWLPFEFSTALRVTGGVTEFRSVLYTGDEWFYFTLLAASLAGLLLNRVKRPLDWLLFAVFSVLAFRYARNIALFALFMYVPMARGFADAADRLAALVGNQNPAMQVAWIRLAGWAGSAAVFLLVFLKPVIVQPWGAGPQPFVFPETAARAMLDIHPPGRLYNHYDIGGYLGWALRDEYQVFVDGRNFEANRALSAYRAISTGRQGWQRALDQYGVSAIITQATYAATAALIPLVGHLANDPDWQLAARGERGMLFLRRGSVPDLPAHYRLDKREVWAQVRMEAEFFLSFNPNLAPAYISLGEAWLGLGRPDQALQAFRTYLRLNPDDHASAAKVAEIEARLDQQQNRQRP
jgi:tetratricopeptide (TPR) repeat protein